MKQVISSGVKVMFTLMSVSMLATSAYAYDCGTTKTTATNTTVLPVVAGVEYAEKTAKKPMLSQQIMMRLDSIIVRFNRLSASAKNTLVTRIADLQTKYTTNPVVSGMLSYLVNGLEMSNIVDVASEAGMFSTLLAAAQAADLADTLANQGPFTVFAPTDEAFADLLSALGLTAEELLADKETLTAVLLYHVVNGKVMAQDVLALDNGSLVPTVGGETLRVTNVGGKVMLDNSITVVSTDITASNGVIHVIDKVLLPSALRTTVSLPIDRYVDSIVEVAQTNGAFPTLLAALNAAGLANALDENKMYTVFAPTEEAFANLLSALGLTAEELLADTTLLKSVLLYHIVPGRYLASDVVGLASPTDFTSLQGTTLKIGVVDGKPMVNNATITSTDVFAKNGVIHVIDTVLVPTE